MERNAKFQWIFCLLLGCATSLVAQNVANWGLTHPQPKETLPKSKAQIMMPTPKTQTPVEAVVEKIGENDFLLNRGWKLTDGKNGWYNATVPGTVLTTLVDQGVYPDPYYGIIWQFPTLCAGWIGGIVWNSIHLFLQKAGKPGWFSKVSIIKPRYG